MIRQILILGFVLSVTAGFAQGKITRPTKVQPNSSQPNPTNRSNEQQNLASRTESKQIEGYIDGHECVDLGLPSGVKWATCNVGASTPSDYGYYYAWGEIASKATYTDSNSKTRGKIIYDISGDAQYDVAYINWGNRWRLPRMADMEELKSKCVWSWTTQGGCKGYHVTGPNGRSIFLPAAGWRFDTLLRGAGNFGAYWSSTPHVSQTERAHYLYFNNSSYDVNWDNSRRNGLPVRPVSDY